MSSLSEDLGQTIISDYLDDEKVLTLALSIWYWSEVGKNPNTNPPAAGKIIETAQHFQRHLQN